MLKNKMRDAFVQTDVACWNGAITYDYEKSTVKSEHSERSASKESNIEVKLADLMMKKGINLNEESSVVSKHEIPFPNMSFQNDELDNMAAISIRGEQELPDHNIYVPTICDNCKKKSAHSVKPLSSISKTVENTPKSYIKVVGNTS